MTADEGGFDIGGYAPIGYAITPWTKLFPALASPVNTVTLSTMYIAKLYTYYLTRLQFGQYLSFLGDVGGDNCGNDAIDDDVSFYDGLCATLYGSIVALEEGASVGESEYTKTVQDFENSLTAGTNDEAFFSQKVYSFFFKNYQLLTQCAYGFVEVRRDAAANLKDYGTNLWTYAPIPQNPFAILPMLEDACRYYPVVMRDGSCVFFQYGNDPNTPTVSGWYTKTKYLGTDGWDELIGSPIQLDGAFKYLDAGSPLPRFYMVGIQTVPTDYAGEIRGLPMFCDMPFEFLAAYATPNESKPMTI